MLLRRATLDRVGWFDERFGHGNFEDDDLSLRLRLHGYRLVIARRAFLHHEGHATFRSLGLDVPTEIARRRRQFVDKWQADPAGRAAIAAMQPDLQAAASAAAMARRIWPRWPDADWHLASWHASNGEHAAAAQALRNLLRTCPHHSEAALALGRALLNLGEVDAASAHLVYTARSFHLDAGQLVGVLTALGQLDLRRERPASATAHFLAAAELRPEDGGLHNWVGACQLATGDLEAAEQSFRTAVATDFALAHTNLGICLHRRGRGDEARRSFERAVALLPHDATAQRNLAAAVGGSTSAVVSSPDP
jgi:Flp pilus assembly protein TadD